MEHNLKELGKFLNVPAPADDGLLSMKERVFWSLAAIVLMLLCVATVGMIAWHIVWPGIQAASRLSGL